MTSTLVETKHKKGNTHTMIQPQNNGLNINELNVPLNPNNRFKYAAVEKKM